MKERPLRLGKMKERPLRLGKRIKRLLRVRQKDILIGRMAKQNASAEHRLDEKRYRGVEQQSRML